MQKGNAGIVPTLLLRKMAQKNENNFDGGLKKSTETFLNQ